MTDRIDELVELLRGRARQYRKAWGDANPNVISEQAADALTALQDKVRVLEVKAISYDHAHEEAVEMGYPSLTEALEHLDELRALQNKEPGR